MQAEYCRSRSGAGQRGENRCVPPTAETHVEDGSKKYKPEPWGASDRSDGSNLRLGNVCRRHQLRHNKKYDAVAKPQRGISEAHQPHGRDTVRGVQSPSGECKSCYYGNRLVVLVVM